MIEIITENLLPIITAIAGIGAWGYERKKRKLDLTKMRQNNELSATDNNTAIVELYQNALSDLKERYDVKFSEMEKEILELKKNAEMEHKKYISLKRAFEDYKRKTREQKKTDQ